MSEAKLCPLCDGSGRLLVVACEALTGAGRPCRRKRIDTKTNRAWTSAAAQRMLDQLPDIRRLCGMHAYREIRRRRAIW